MSYTAMIRQNWSKIFIIGAVVILYFMIFEHYWYWSLMGGFRHSKYLHIVSLGLLLYISFRRFFLEKDKPMLNLKFTKRLSLLILICVVFSFITVIYHEHGIDDIKRYTFNLLIPVILMGAIGYLYDSNSKMQETLRVIFVAGLILSIYAVIVHKMLLYGAVSSYYISDALPQGYRLWLKEGTLFGIDYIKRFSIPGLGANQFPSMLVPLVFVGFYFSKNRTGYPSHMFLLITFFLYYNMIMTSSKGALVSFLFGFVYLIWKRWFSIKREKTYFILLSLVVITLSQQDFVSRLMKIRNDMQSTFLIAKYSKEIAKVENKEIAKVENKEIAGLLQSRQRYSTIADSLRQFLDNPIIGVGITNLMKHQATALNKNFEHNFYLRMLASGGLVLLLPILLIFALLFLSISKKLGKADLSGEQKELGILLKAGFISWLVDLNFSVANAQYYWIWFGLVAAWIRNCNDSMNYEKTTCSEQIRQS